MAENMLGRAARALMERKIPAYKDDAIWAEDRGSILMRLTRDQDGFAEARAASGSRARKAASAKIAKIPFALSSWIARTYKPAADRAA